MAHRISKKDGLLFNIFIYSECSFAELMTTGSLHTDISTAACMSAIFSEYGIHITKGDRMAIA